MSLQLWIANKNYSSWSLRPWFLLKALNIPFDEQLATFVPGGSSYEKFLRFSPSGLVPCLVTADTTVWDSLAICEYIAEDYPHVWPQEKTARAWARSAAAEMHSGFTTLRRECPLNCSESRPAAEMTPELQKECQRLDKIWCEGLTRFGGPWLAGENISAADAFYVPVALRARTYQLPFSAAAQAWVDRILAHPAIIEWCEAAAKEEKITHD
ncbi:glutathione S-transferase family protein [Morganella morganii]|uniref:glutathione S-transferase family protein n=1 Tax=Morganella morganii TaxID=582 RepID=UPI0018973460|nr:glutathione S-transferase family protein [Morganella morganii]MBS5195185.1 glutathione S-transferase family protein [Morganella morganii]MBT0384630.1 glutathione S-transferase family protein [Morganella morganii subsp. morganii]HDU8581274.1 glutathione S-transferase family protein [Morganella morganii]